MIHTDADGSMMLLADVEERYEAILNLLEFVGILLVGIFLLDELAGRIHVVARIDAHFLTIESSHVGNIRIEVNIGYERSLIAVGTNAGIDVFHVLCLAGTLSGEAHQLATSLDNLLTYACCICRLYLLFSSAILLLFTIFLRLATFLCNNAVYSAHAKLYR